MAERSIKFMENSLKECVTIPYNNYQEKLKEIMDTFGFVVITGILDNDECTNAEKLLYEDFLECIDESVNVNSQLQQSIDKVKNSTEHWPQASIPGIPKKGFMSTNGFPQGKFAWTMRTNPKVKEIFAYLHNTTDLVVGMDVPFFSATGKDLSTTSMWPHADQDTRLNYGSKNSYQGILYAWDATTSDRSTTVVWPKSANTDYEKLLGSIPTAFGEGHGLYIDRIQDNTTRANLMNKWYKNARRIQVPAGGLIIFNSKSIHQGYPSGYRLAQAISWAPKANRSEDAYKRKLQAVHMEIATTHWAELGIHHGASFKRNPKPKSDKDHQKCIFPMKPLQSKAAKHKVPAPKKASLQDLMDSIKDEYRDII